MGYPPRVGLRPGHPHPASSSSLPCFGSSLFICSCTPPAPVLLGHLCDPQHLIWCYKSQCQVNTYSMHEITLVYISDFILPSGVISIIKYVHSLASLASTPSLSSWLQCQSRCMKLISQNNHGFQNDTDESIKTQKTGFIGK